VEALQVVGAISTSCWLFDSNSLPKIPKNFPKTSQNFSQKISPKLFSKTSQKNFPKLFLKTPHTLKTLT
jgi:hypothetical protein